jgi:hypothetical protein
MRHADTCSHGNVPSQGSLTYNIPFGETPLKRI